jgi:hypothetical protein
MSAMPDSTFADPQELIADLQRQLAASNAERDKAQRMLIESTAELSEALEQRQDRAKNAQP